MHDRGHDGICIPMQMPGDDLAAVMAGLTATANVAGILVTMPHKFTAFSYWATNSQRAKVLYVVSIIAATSAAAGTATCSTDTL